MYQFPHYSDYVPDELKEGNVWVCCDKNKVPLTPRLKGISRASSTNPDTWRSYEQAVRAYIAQPAIWGIGRVIEEGSPYVGVDLDDCRDRATGAITPRGRRILTILDSYSEVSPSGTGIKVWVRAGLRRSYVKPGLEVYGGRRYFCVTAQILSQYSPAIEERGAELEALISEEFPKTERKAARDTYRGPRMDLGRLLEAAGVKVLAELADGTAERKFRVLCPWAGEHTGGDESGTFCGQYRSGAPFFWCWHAHCRGRTWKDFRREAKRMMHQELLVRRGGRELKVVVRRG